MAQLPARASGERTSRAAMIPSDWPQRRRFDLSSRERYGQLLNRTIYFLERKPE